MNDQLNPASPAESHELQEKQAREEPPTAPSPVPASPPTRRSPALRLFKIAFKSVLAAVFIYFWVVAVRRSLPDLRGMEWTIRPLALAWSAAAFAAASVLFGVLWSPLCYEITGIRLGLVRAFRASMLAWAARYLPGKVWSVAGKAYLSCDSKSQAVPVTIALTVETFWFELSGLLLAAIMLPWAPGLRALARGSAFASALFVAFGFILAYPPVFCFFSNLALKMMRQPPLPRRPRYSALLALLVGYMAVFALFSVSFLILAHALAPVRPADHPFLISAFTSSWVFGVLVFLSPGGLGVRETGLMKLLDSAGLFPMPVIAKLVVYSRLVTLSVEALCALVSLALPLLGFGGKPKPE